MSEKQSNFHNKEKNDTSTAHFCDKEFSTKITY